MCLQKQHDDANNFESTVRWIFLLSDVYLVYDML